MIMDQKGEEKNQVCSNLMNREVKKTKHMRSFGANKSHN